MGDIDFTDDFEEVRKRIDTLVEDFKYVSDFCLELFESLPAYMWWDHLRQKVKQVKSIYNKYWVD